MSRPSHRLPPGHVIVPAFAIGSMALVLAIGLGAMGLLARLNGVATEIIKGGGLSDLPKSLPQGLIWLFTVIVAYGLAAAMLGVPCVWRRLVLWISTLVMVVFWAPVLGLAAHVPAIAAPLVAVVWSGVCALVYAHNHRMPVDEPTAMEAHGES